MENDFSTLPENKTELIRRIRITRAALEDAIRLLSEADLAAPGPDGGWSVKDHLIHLAEWRWKVLAIITGRPAYEGLRINAQTYQSGGLEEINALLYERNRQRPTAEVLDEFHRAHDAVLDAVVLLDEADLRRPYDLSDPSDTRTLLEGIIANTYGHDLEHLAWIKELITPPEMGNN